MSKSEHNKKEQQKTNRVKINRVHLYGTEQRMDSAQLGCEEVEVQYSVWSRCKVMGVAKADYDEILIRK